MTDHSDYDSSRSSSTVPDSGRSYVSDTSFSGSLRSFGGESTTTTAGAATGAGAGKPHKANHAAWEAMKRLRLETAGGVGLDHFRLLRRVGSGDIGNVYLCRLRRASATEVPECMYAMKVVDREALAFRKKLERAETEKEILGMLDHPFLPTLYAQFDVSHYSCLVMEFCPGGDLHAVRQRQPGRKFSVSSTKFYAAEILLALEYLHMMGVVYRDLKPENVLVRDDGHIMLSDFDLSLKCDVMPRLMTPEATTATTAAAERTPFCSGPSCAIHMKPVLTCFYGAANRGSGSEKDHKKKEKERRPIEPELVAEPVSARSRSFVGTHEYLAPEVISGMGHGSEVDWWTLGVFMYELLFGRTPFKGEDNEKTLINIIKQPLRFPRLDINSTSCRDMEELVKARDLISRLLVKNPKRRIGSLRGAVEIKRHEFFKGVNWALIRTVKPPEVPKESQKVRNKEPVGGVVAAQRHGKRERGASATYSIPQYFEYF